MVRELLLERVEKEGEEKMKKMKKEDEGQEDEEDENKENNRRRRSKRRRDGVGPRVLVNAANSRSDLEQVLQKALLEDEVIQSKLLLSSSCRRFEFRVEGGGGGGGKTYSNGNKRCSRRREKSRDVISWAVDLAARTVGQMHSDCWGWNEKEMMRELSSPAAILLIAKQSTNNSSNKTDDILFQNSTPSPSPSPFMGFCHFRFDLEEDDAVLYLYEMHIEPLFQNKGIGGVMMRAIKTLAKQCSMQRIILTVSHSRTKQ